MEKSLVWGRDIPGETGIVWGIETAIVELCSNLSRSSYGVSVEYIESISEARHLAGGIDLPFKLHIVQHIEI